MAEKKKEKNKDEDPYAEYVWPAPPDEPRIKLEEVITGRADVEGESKFKKMLIGASPQSPYDHLRKPFAVDFDLQGRILVTDATTSALIRFDRENDPDGCFLAPRVRVRLKRPVGIARWSRRGPSTSPMRSRRG